MLIMLKWARRVRLLRQAASPPLPSDLPHLANEQLQSAWKRWILLEERKRYRLSFLPADMTSLISFSTALGIFILDAELAKLHHHGPYLRPATERLPTISSDALFAARNANMWGELVHQQSQEPGGRTVLPRSYQSVLGPMRERKLGGGTSDFELCAMLESISAMSCEYHESFSTAPQFAQECQEMLIRWYETNRSTIGPGNAWAYPLMILWHSTFILLYSNLDVLERACGRDGPEAAQEAVGYARQWANSQDATRTLMHAVCIRRQFESMPIGSECPLHVPTCLYHCGIIWFCFGHFGNSSNGAGVERNFPELDLIGVHANQIDATELGNSKLERNAANQVFRIIGLLQSIRHWKLSLSLASTLLALIEAQDNVF